MIIGLGGIMAEHLANQKEPIDLHLRLILVGSQSLAEIILWVLVGGKGKLDSEVSGKGWLAYLRFYGPTEAYYDQTWKLEDIVAV
jgi:hypothetical protein